MSASFGFVEPKWPTTTTTTTRIRRRESFFDIFSVRICQPQDRHRKHNIHTPVVGSGSSKPNKRKKKTFLLLLFLYFPREKRERKKKEGKEDVVTPSRTKRTTVRPTSPDWRNSGSKCNSFQNISNRIQNKSNHKKRKKKLQGKLVI
jgi:hypothetical protein